MTRAVVIGGSIAGCLAAAALHTHFDEVLVLDRDDFPEGPERRKGAAHGSQIHTLLTRGLRALETFFPGFVDDAVAQGCHVVPITEGLMSRRRYGWAPRVSSEVDVLMASRPMIEHLIRSRARQLDGVVFRTGAVVRGLRAGGASGAVDGVLLEGGEVVVGDLVVDASGRSSAAPDWLDALGYDRPAETVVDAKFGYASCLARWRRDPAPAFDAISALPMGAVAEGAARTRGAAIWRIEGPDRWIVTAIGNAGDLPPGDDAGFLDFLRSLPYPEIAEMLDGLDLELPAKVWRRTVNRLRHYEKLDRRPEGFILMGDAVAAFNPVYGQGMTAAALEAELLGAVLEERGRSGAPLVHQLASTFQLRLLDVVSFCWDVSTQADYRVEGVEGVEGPALPPDAGSRMAFMDRVDALAGQDPEIFVKMMETLQLVRSPHWLGDESLRQYVEENWDQLGSVAFTA